MRTCPGPGGGTGRVVIVNGVAGAERMRAVWVGGTAVAIVVEIELVKT